MYVKEPHRLQNKSLGTQRHCCSTSWTLQVSKQACGECTNVSQIYSQRRNKMYNGIAPASNSSWSLSLAFVVFIGLYISSYTFWWNNYIHIYVCIARLAFPLLTFTHTHIYIYIYVYMSTLFSFAPFHLPNSILVQSSKPVLIYLLDVRLSLSNLYITYTSAHINTHISAFLSLSSTAFLSHSATHG